MYKFSGVGVKDQVEEILEVNGFLCLLLPEVEKCLSFAFKCSAVNKKMLYGAGDILART